MLNHKLLSVELVLAECTLYANPVSVPRRRSQPSREYLNRILRDDRIHRSKEEHKVTPKRDPLQINMFQNRTEVNL